MAGTGKKILILILSLVIGIGVTFFGTSLAGPLLKIDQMMQILIAVVLTIFTYIAFYYMTKGSG
ncbi:MAG: hypothetical protein AB1295_00645 [Candidatus Micrarchaeota archaeon]